MVDIHDVTTLFCLQSNHAGKYWIRVDLTGFKNPEILLNGLTPNIVVKNSKKHSVIELSSCYETNFVKTSN